RVAVHRSLPPCPTRRSSDLRRFGPIWERSAACLFPVLTFMFRIISKALPTNWEKSSCKPKLVAELPDISGNCAIAERRLRITEKDRKSTRLNSSHVKNSYAV